MQCFSKQIFLDGFIHADPHPGNLLVRRYHGKTQIVILDHGLYSTYDTIHIFFRLYCRDFDFVFHISF
jgi:aarF domain-containing kinase